MSIVVTDIASGTVIDRVTLDGGHLGYETGAAQGLFDAKRPLGLDDAGVYALMSDWSNGYARAEENSEPDVQAASGDTAAQRIQAQWDAAKARLLARWPKIAGPLVDELAQQAKTAAAAGDLGLLAEIRASAGVVAAVAVPLAKSGTELALEAAAGVVEEAATQGTEIDVPAAPGAEQIIKRADVVARIIANGYASGAAKTALQLAGARPGEVRGEVERHLTELGQSTNGLVGTEIAGLLSAAQFAGRLAVLEQHPAESYVSVEVNDRSKCARCAEVAGTSYPTLRAALEDYIGGGIYRACLGRSRCRGYVRPLW